MRNKYLSDVLSVDDVLCTNENRICILAGVGAGKNTFVTEHLRGHGNIFFVSSRRMTINKMLLDEICQEIVNWDEVGDELFTTTNYGVELLVKNERFSTTGIKNLIEHYDIFVIDEFHSIQSDSTFANSAFHLYSFLNYISEKYPYKKIIVMTGTQEPIKDILERDNYKVIDRTSECINILPKRIEVISKDKAIKLIHNLPEEQQTIYYTNSATGIFNNNKNEKPLYDKICGNNIYSNKNIAIAIADSAAEKIEREEIFIPNLKLDVKATKDGIAHNEKLNDDIKILIATSTIKEGVNIISDKIKVAFCETHLLSDIQQFAGRVRNGLDVLYIIDSAFQFDIKEKQQSANFMELILSMDLLDPINLYLDKQVLNENSLLYKRNFGNYHDGNIGFFKLFLDGNFSLSNVNKAAKTYIKMIEDKFNYIRFNHLITKFESFTLKYREQERIYQYYMNGWEKTVREYCQSKGIDYVNNTANKQVNISNVTGILKNYLDIKLIGNEKKKLLSQLAPELGLKENARFKTFRDKLIKYNIPYTIFDGLTSINGKNERYIEVLTTENYQKRQQKKDSIV